MSALHITCVALASAVGLTPASAAAAMRCGISGIGELPTVDDALEPVAGARVPSIPDHLHGRDRLIELLLQVMADSHAALGTRIDITQLPVLLCTSEVARPGASVHGIVPAMEARLGFHLRRAGARHLARGHVSCFESLGFAEAAMLQAGGSACLVIAADSLIDPRSLNWLEKSGRLKTSRRSEGVIPGEGAAVLLVSLEPLGEPCMVLQGIGMGHDDATVLNDIPQMGSGMSAAVAAALQHAGIEMHDIAFRLSDVAGEAHGFEDLALVQSRLMQRTRASQDLWHPASSVGDCGAASALMQLAWIEQAHMRGYAPGEFSLAHASSPTGARAAAVLSGPAHGEHRVS